MLADSPLLRRAALWVLAAAAFVGVAAIADVLGAALSAVAAPSVSGV